MALNFTFISFLICTHLEFCNLPKGNLEFALELWIVNWFSRIGIEIDKMKNKPINNYYLSIKKPWAHLFQLFAEDSAGTSSDLVALNIVHNSWPCVFINASQTRLYAERVPVLLQQFLSPVWSQIQESKRIYQPLLSFTLHHFFFSFFSKFHHPNSFHEPFL